MIIKLVEIFFFYCGGGVEGCTLAKCDVIVLVPELVVVGGKSSTCNSLPLIPSFLFCFWSSVTFCVMMESFVLQVTGYHRWPFTLKIKISKLLCFDCVEGQSRSNRGSAVLSQPCDCKLDDNMLYWMMNSTVFEKTTLTKRSSSLRSTISQTLCV